MKVGQATIDLVQLQRRLDHQPPTAAKPTVRAWIEKAVLFQREDVPMGHISGVFPHIRPPPDQASLPWCTPLANDRLLCCLVADDPTIMRYLNPIQIMNHGLGLSGLKTRAIANLSLLPPYSISECSPHPEQPDTWVVNVGDGHDAARILLADVIAGGPVVAWIPHRDQLVFTTRTVDAIGQDAARLRQNSIRSAQSATHPISAEAFRVEKGILSHLPFHGDEDAGILKQPDQ